jgi:hypothetical protein
MGSFKAAFRKRTLRWPRQPPRGSPDDNKRRPTARTTASRRELGEECLCLGLAAGS